MVDVFAEIRSNTLKDKGLLPMDQEDQNKNVKIPDPEAFENALKSVAEFLETQNKLYKLIRSLSDLLPPKTKKEVLFTSEMFRSMFLSEIEFDNIFNNVSALHPTGISLVALDNFFKNSDRFEIVDPTTLPYHNKCEIPYSHPKLTHTTLELASESFNVPLANELWLKDKEYECNFIINYEPAQGSVNLIIQSGADYKRRAIEFAHDIKKYILESRFFRGQILEIDSNFGFKIVDIGEQQMPVISEDLTAELEKNVINLFDKEAEFKKYGLPIKRSIILEGPPGCGKTMIARHLAFSLKGKVTTIWVTAKSISQSSDVAYVFDIARKLSPSLIVMEDLDLISGTRESQLFGHGENCLGEMLNQLDGLTANDSIVLVGSTNAVASLDDALKDRPGRFDRIYEIGHPNSELAELIARNYLIKCGVTQSQVDKITFSSILTGSYSGAQIVEIVKGGIFEAIHRGIPIDDRCIKVSRDGLDKQKARIQKVSK